MSLGSANAPLEPGRELARQWARQELSDPVYARARPGWLRRAVDWALDQLSRIEIHPTRLTDPRTAVVLLVALAVVVLVVVRLRRGRLRGAAQDAERRELFGAVARTAAAHRRLADEAAAAERWADAVRERFRAVVRTLDERALLDDRPGRTADEAAGEAGRVLPDLAAGLTDAARRFDDVTYGDAAAGPADDARLRALDQAVTQARLPVGARP
ncbi:DUF4129 domain-containing protein [Angustibacter luteus]|uniref:DUF4129 domain-containing protein n=1 Tax=Angustibacter luteus TaxID=658456 RepID=A0ABW1JH07_9ACTN